MVLASERVTLKVASLVPESPSLTLVSAMEICGFSQASPTPSPSASSWFGLGSLGQLSVASAIPSASLSVGGGVVPGVQTKALRLSFESSPHPTICPSVLIARASWSTKPESAGMRLLRSCIPILSEYKKAC